MLSTQILIFTAIAVLAIIIIAALLWEIWGDD
jgi:type IV secretory pathway component VirB8